jgi:hypothetical protein
MPSFYESFARDAECPKPLFGDTASRLRDMGFAGSFIRATRSPKKCHSERRPKAAVEEPPHFACRATEASFERMKISSETSALRTHVYFHEISAIGGIAISLDRRQTSREPPSLPQKSCQARIDASHSKERKLKRRLVPSPQLK